MQLFIPTVVTLLLLLARPDLIQGDDDGYSESVDDDPPFTTTDPTDRSELDAETVTPVTLVVLRSPVNIKCTLAADSGSCPVPSSPAEVTPPSTGNKTANETTSSVGSGIRYFYSTTNYKCAEFPYTGCGGNGNNFLTLEQCRAECDKPSADVDKIKVARETAQCWYKNKLYKEGEAIRETTEDNACSVGCLCGGGGAGGGALKITCAAIDCPPPPETLEKCVPIYKTKTCCPASWSCVDDLKNKNQANPSKVMNGTTAGVGGAGATTAGSGPGVAEEFKCKYDGEEYVEGQNIYPKEYPCYTCPCTRNFTGVVGTSLCEEVNCGIAIHRQLELVNQCEPQYYKTDAGKDSCCPIDWNCAVSLGDTGGAEEEDK